MGVRGVAIISLTWAIDPGRHGAAGDMLSCSSSRSCRDFVADGRDVVRPVLWAYSLAATATALIGTWA